MAEAHQAVAFQFAIDPEGEVDIHIDWFVLRALYLQVKRRWKLRYLRFINHLHNGVYPVKPISWIIFVGIIGILHAADFDYTLGLKPWILWLPLIGWLSENGQEIAVALIWGSLLYKIYSILLRSILKRLLAYKGWINAAHGKPSLVNKVWMGLVYFLSHRNPMLFSLQNSLPPLPLPPVKETIDRYLLSVRPLQSDEEFEKTSEMARLFLAKDGNKLQIWLWLKWWWSTNYVSDWWEQYVYLAGRSPIMVNSNYYGIDAINSFGTSFQASRAGNMVYFVLKFRQLIDRERLPPCFVNNTIPMCSWQYQRQFNTTRLPGKDRDHLQHLGESNHIAVLHAGRWFKVPLMFRGELLTPAEWELVFQAILNDTAKPCAGETELAALTAGKREEWFDARQYYFRTGVNRTSLDAIEQSAFVLVLDQEDYMYDKNDDTKLNHWASSMLHGKCYDRWFDKSFNLIIGKNARVGFNGEHSWADAPIMAHLWEYVLAYDGHVYGYKKDGKCNGTVSDGYKCKYSKLNWDITERCQEKITNSLKVAQKLALSVDLQLLPFDEYGKDFIKTCRVSPDAYVQMALQVAQFRDQKKFCLTYEAAMTRVFVHGRTETVRSCTVPAVEFARAMDDPRKSADEKRELLKVACDNHQHLTRLALVGDGVDRHLFALYVVSKVLGTKAPFLEEVIQAPWRLSTSQTPTNQTDIVDFSQHPELVSAGGGFGPVADDGYGVSYIICGDKLITFHVSSKKEFPTTDSRRFASHISGALRDMAKLYER